MQHIKVIRSHIGLTHRFNGPFSGTTQVSRYQKGGTNLDFTEARDSEWQWHQLGQMQVCTLLQTDNHTSIPPLSFLQAGCPSCRPTNSVKALHYTRSNNIYWNRTYSWPFVGVVRPRVVKDETHVAAKSRQTRVPAHQHLLMHSTQIHRVVNHFKVILRSTRNIDIIHNETQKVKIFIAHRTTFRTDTTGSDIRRSTAIPLPYINISSD